MQKLLQPPDKPLAPLAPPPRPGPAPALWSRKDTKQALSHTPKGGGAAVGGARWEHWRVVLGTPSAVTALHEMLQRVAAADLPQSVVDAFALAKLTALNKPGGGVRPIAPPSLLRRLALACEQEEN